MEVPKNCSIKLILQKPQLPLTDRRKQQLGRTHRTTQPTHALLQLKTIHRLFYHQTAVTLLCWRTGLEKTHTQLMGAHMQLKTHTQFLQGKMDKLHIQKRCQRFSIRVHFSRCSHLFRRFDSTWSRSNGSGKFTETWNVNTVVNCSGTKSTITSTYALTPRSTRIIVQSVATRPSPKAL